MIEAIIQSSDYADLLAITLPLNKGHFDRLRVYTKPDDKATMDVCAANGVECIETYAFTKNQSSFNRGAAYNEAFKDLKEDWVCIIDSDIVLPSDFRARLDAAGLHPEYFYGARRYNIETMMQWQDVQQDATKLANHTLFRGYGYGYLQLFNRHSFIFKSLLPDAYPEHHDGSEADWRFRNCWGDLVWKPPFDINGHAETNVEDPGTHYLRCLPFHVIHLGITGVNVTGRATPLFTTNTTA